jgi:sodium-coupled neutral amino acid transporter 11
MVAYLLIIKDTVPTIFGFGAADDGGFERELILIGTSLVIIVPLAAQRDMASLAFTSLLSICADIILVGFIVVFSPVVERVSDEGGFVEVLKNDAINPTLFIGLGVLSTAMACQHSAFIVSGSLENKTQKRWSIVTFRSIFIAAFLCALFGIFGYLGFLEDTKGDVLNNFEAGSLAANGARILLAITMFLTCKYTTLIHSNGTLYRVNDFQTISHSLLRDFTCIFNFRSYGIICCEACGCSTHARR